MWQEAENFLSKDKYIGPLIKKWGGCTIKKSPKSNYFVDLLEATTNQQLSGKAASTIFGRVRYLCKGDVSPKAILKLSEAKLRSAGLSYAKIKYIKDLADKVKSGELKIKSLDKLPDEEVKRELVAVKGIGPWTADMFLMFSLGRPDIFPLEDLGINKAIIQLFSKRSLASQCPGKSVKTINKEKILKISERWKPWRTVASWYLWRSLENR